MTVNDYTGIILVLIMGIVFWVDMKSRGITYGKI